MTRDEALTKATQLAGDLKKELGDVLAMVAVYGSIVRGDFAAARSDVNMIICLERADMAVLDRIAGPLQQARVSFRCAPMVLSREEIVGSADVFPIKFCDMRRNYTVLAGSDLLAPLAVAPHDLRLACEHELRNITLKLRRAFLIERPHVEPVLRSLRLFVPQILSVLRVLDEHGLHVAVDPADRQAWIERLAKHLDIDPESLLASLTLRDHAETPWPEVERTLGRLLDALAHICHYVDSLPATSADR